MIGLSVSGARMIQNGIKHVFKSSKDLFQNGTANDKINVGVFDPSQMVAIPIKGSMTQRLGFCLRQF